MRVNKGMTDALRFQIIEEYLSGASKYSLAKKYKLSSPARIRHWLRIFGIEEPQESIIMTNKPKKENAELAALKQELKRIKAELAYERMRADAFETMIDLTEEDLKISIKKKDVTKP